MTDVSQILDAIQAGEPQAAERLLPFDYVDYGSWPT
jgi:hypothetical protein